MSVPPPITLSREFAGQAFRLSHPVTARHCTCMPFVLVRLPVRIPNNHIVCPFLGTTTWQDDTLGCHAENFLRTRRQSKRDIGFPFGTVGFASSFRHYYKLRDVLVARASHRCLGCLTHRGHSSPALVLANVRIQEGAPYHPAGSTDVQSLAVRLPWDAQIGDARGGAAAMARAHPRCTCG